MKISPVIDSGLVLFNEVARTNSVKVEIASDDWFLQKYTVDAKLLLRAKEDDSNRHTSNLNSRDGLLHASFTPSYNESKEMCRKDGIFRTFRNFQFNVMGQL